MKKDERYLRLMGGNRGFDLIKLDMDYILETVEEDFAFRNCVELNRNINGSLYVLKQLGIVQEYTQLGMYGTIKIRDEYSLKMYKEIDKVYKSILKEMNKKIKYGIVEYN